MRLDMQRDQVLAKRKGLARKTIVAFIWIGLCFVAAYFVLEWLVTNEVISYRFFYSRLFVPQTVDQELLQLGLMVMIVVIINFFVLIGYGLISPAGRRRPGTPSPYSQDPDPDDGSIHYR